jgi:hypothetical protein
MRPKYGEYAGELVIAMACFLFGYVLVQRYWQGSGAPARSARGLGVLLMLAGAFVALSGAIRLARALYSS